MKKFTEPFDIDLVYLWVDGNDPEWIVRKNRFLGRDINSNNEATSKGRFTDSGELKYSLRSVEKNVPWIRRIFIVTDGQTPMWLDLRNEKVEIIDIRQILPPEALPCYNSVIIEHFLWKIPDLAEHFLYANDDMFFNAELLPDFFFTSDGFPIVRLQRSLFGKWINKSKKTLKIHTNIYRKTIDRAALLIEKKFGKYYSGTPHHNIDSYLKSDYQLVSEKIFRHEIHSTIIHHIRSENDIQRIIYLYYALAVKRGELRYVGRGESCRIRLHKPDYMYFINRYRPALFCLNDSHHATDEDRGRVEPFLKTLFPKRSSFETNNLNYTHGLDKIGIVVQRYGKEVNGGAELHARLLAERLKKIYEVDVITSCALDHHTWENHYPAGEEVINGVRVLRFMNENDGRKENRRLSRYLRGNQKYYNTGYKLGNIFTLSFRRLRYRKRKNHDQRFDLWIEGHGPVCKGMMSYLAQEKSKYRVLIFFTYLYYPTYFGLQKAADKSILIPTAHDEPMFYFSGFGKMFSLPKFIMYNTESEKLLVESTYPDTRRIKSDIAGVGFDKPVLDEGKQSEIGSVYFVYIGRIDINKGCKELIEYFSQLNKSGLKLVMIGKNHLLPPVKSDNIIFTGFIDEPEKLAYLQHCEALIIPSRYESLSMVTLEAMSAGKPVLANGHCEVLRNHIERSDAGFVYYDEKDFAGQINKILTLSAHDKQVIAQNGRSYVERNFQWDNIMRKFVAAIEYVGTTE